jgi:uncharacterized protein
MTSKPNLAAGSVTIDLRGLGEGDHPIQVDAPGRVLRIEDEERKVFRDVALEGTLTRNDTILRLSGVLRGTLEASCDRCLTRFESPIETELALRVEIGNEGPVPSLESPAGSDSGEERVVRLAQEATALELSDALREAVLLEIPIKSLCREDCQGLCPRCGANRNLEPCDCDLTPRDPRWGALRELSFPSDDQE